MANGNIPFYPYNVGSSATVPVLFGPKGATEAWKEGAVLVEDTAQLDEALPDPAANTIIGVAAEPTTTAAAAGTNVPFYPNLPGQCFIGTLNVAAGGYVLAAADFLTAYGMAIDTDGIHYINQADTTGPTVNVLGFVDSLGTANGRVIFNFNDGALW